MVVLGDLYFMHGGCEVSRRSTMSPLLAFPTKYLGVRTSNIGSIMPLGIKSCKFEPQPFRPKCITESSSSFSLLHSHFGWLQQLATGGIMKSQGSQTGNPDSSREGRKQKHHDWRWTRHDTTANAVQMGLVTAIGEAERIKICAIGTMYIDFRLETAIIPQSKPIGMTSITLTWLGTNSNRG